MSAQPWRLYRPEWVIAHTVTVSGIDARPCLVVAQDWADQNLKGRVRDEDIRFTMNTDQHLVFWCNIEVFKENLKGEFKYAVAAANHATERNYDEYTIVERNSAEDKKIRSYGVSIL